MDNEIKDIACTTKLTIEVPINQIDGFIEYIPYDTTLKLKIELGYAISEETLKKAIKIACDKCLERFNILEN
ncbi:hypothetical protein KLN18_18655 [Clostridioides difficile]|nr:hypothetical protein [Clostridioides difficile]MDO0133071.1 hypothetical protein [Clostridioides difficile]